MGERLAPDLQNEGFQVFLFNYYSYNGIVAAINTLRGTLNSYDILTRGEISRKKVFLIGHSMGGLVARRFAVDNDARRFVRGIVMLGTPNNGVLQKRLKHEQIKRLINYLIDAGEALAKFPIPRAKLASCLATAELLKMDTNENEPMIDILNNRWCQDCELPPTLSVSGGENFLYFGKSEFTNKAKNLFIQQLIGNTKNDGIVTENSVDMTSFLAMCTPERHTHCKCYDGYNKTNHNNIHVNQIVILEILKWLDEQKNQKVVRA